MPKTEVILIQNVVGLGGESDQVKVAAGYARNFLFPQGLAIPLTGANKRRLEVLRTRRSDREAKELSSMSEIGAALSKVTLVIKVKTGEDGKLFGSVTQGTVADELKHQLDVAIDKRKIHLPQHIKAVGDYDVELHLHADVHTTMKLKVESTAPAPAPVVAAAPARGGKAPAAETARPGAKGEEKREKPERADRPKAKPAKTPKA